MFNSNRFIPSRTQRSGFVAGMLGALLVVGGLWLAGSPVVPGSQASADAAYNARLVDYKLPPLPEGYMDFRAASKLALPAVVHIKSSIDVKTAERKGGRREMPGMPEQFRDLFGDKFDFYGGPDMPRDASGSGVIISEDGYIVTNNHVIREADKVEVTLFDNRKFEVKVIGTDPSTDIALLKADASDLPYLRYGNSDEVEVGEWVLAVGNPFNLTSTVTAGIVSAKGRNLNLLEDRFRIESFIQTDAAVNPGNSGGALINTKGELIGINTAIASHTGTYNGYSFAVPVGMVQKIVSDLMKFGEVQRGFLGVMIQDVSAELAKEKDLKVHQGVYVNEVNGGSAAADAGLKKGDVIVKIDGNTVNTSAALQEQIGRRRPGDVVKLTILRDGKEQENAVTLKNKSGNTELVSRDAVLKELGATLETPTDDELKDLKVKAGVRVSSLSPGKLRDAGIEKGFVITRVDRKAVTKPEDIAAILKDRKGAVLIEGVDAEGNENAYAIMF